eukprot:gene13178-9414_t
MEYEIQKWLHEKVELIESEKIKTVNEIKDRLRFNYNDDVCKKTYDLLKFQYRYLEAELEFIASTLKQRKRDLKLQKYYADCDIEEYERGLITNLDVDKHDKILSKKEKKETYDYRQVRNTAILWLFDCLMNSDDINVASKVMHFLEELHGPINFSKYDNDIEALKRSFKNSWNFEGWICGPEYDFSKLEDKYPRLYEILDDD